MTRLTALSATLALLAAGALSAMEPTVQSGGLVIGATSNNDPAIEVDAGLASKYIDNGYLLMNDAVATGRGTVRWFGLGVTLKGAFALSQDTEIVTTGTDPFKADQRSVNPGEMVAIQATVDYLLDIKGVYGADTPFLQIRPYLTLGSYPNQQPNILKDEQNWVGIEAWLALPLPGVEVGADSAWNTKNPAYRGAGGLRELYQVDSFDLQLWQLLNFGNRNNRALYMGYETDTENYSRGLTTSDIGAKVTMASPYRELWFYAQADWTYWLKRDDRDFQRDVLGREPGNLTIALGIEWLPEKK